MSKTINCITVVVAGVHHLSKFFNTDEEVIKFLKDNAEKYGYEYIDGVFSYDTGENVVVTEELEASDEIVESGSFYLLVLMVEGVPFVQGVFLDTQKVQDYIDQGIVDMLEDDEGTETLTILYEMPTD